MHHNFRATCLLPEAVIVPCKVIMYGIIVDSESLLAETALVTDENTLNFKVAEFINEYKVTCSILINLLKLIVKFNN